MGRYISSLLIVFILFGTALFAQERSRKGRDSKRNVDQFKVNAYPVVTEGDNIRLLVYGLIPYQSLQFLKDGDGSPLVTKPVLVSEIKMEIKLTAKHF